MEDEHFYNKKLTEQANDLTKQMLTQRNKLMTEAVISCWLDTHQPHEVAKILVEFADQLIEFL